MLPNARQALASSWLFVRGIAFRLRRVGVSNNAYMELPLFGIGFKGIPKGPPPFWGSPPKKERRTDMEVWQKRGSPPKCGCSRMVFVQTNEKALWVEKTKLKSTTGSRCRSFSCFRDGSNQFPQPGTQECFFRLQHSFLYRQS